MQEKIETVKTLESKYNSVKDIWFDAYYKGNALIPQQPIGITLCVLISTILKDKNFNLEEFLESELSQKQIDSLGDAMSIMHKHYGVDVSNEEKTAIFPHKVKVIEDKNLQQLWEGTKANVVNYLLAYILNTGLKKTYMSNFSMYKVEVITNNIDKFLKDTGGEKMKNLKLALGVIDEELNGVDIKNLTKNYRDEFKKPTKNPRSRSTEIWEVEGYNETFKGIICVKLREKFDNKIPDGILKLFEII